jgi:hypothetical protein
LKWILKALLCGVSPAEEKWSPEKLGAEDRSEDVTFTLNFLSPLTQMSVLLIKSFGQGVEGISQVEEVHG